MLHAFLPAQHVDHVHADVICALTNNAEPERHVREALGEDVVVVPYVRPGFSLSKQVGELSGARAVVMAKHGLVTWGETHEASYGLTLELVAQAQAYLELRLPTDEAVTVPDLSDEERQKRFEEMRKEMEKTRAENEEKINKVLTEEQQARLSEANLELANLVAADLSQADISHAVVVQTSLQEANLRGANLSASDLTGALLNNADLGQADLRGANLSGALGLVQAQLDQACLDEATRIPSELQRPKPCAQPRPRLRK